MSKTFVFKRNRSEDVWRPVQHTPTARRKSLSRERKSQSPTKSLYQSEFPLHASLARDAQTVQSPTPSPRRTSQSVSPQRTRRHRDLKRKFIFQLHEEIKKPTHTTVLEEISDIDTITSICFTTLHAMMENKHQRKFLHHMNNTHNNSSTNNNIQLDKTSNSRNSSKAEDRRSKHIEEEMFKVRRQTMQTAAKANTFDRQSFHQPAKERERGKSQPNIQMPTTVKTAVDSSKKFGKEAATGTGAAQARNPTIRFTEEMTKFLAVADQSAPGAQQKKPEEKQKEEMTPMEALYCPWLRLTKEQVAVLEKLCRDEGIDPGIHAHYDVTDMDVFEDIRNKKDAKGWKAKLSQSRSIADVDDFTESSS